MTPELLASIAGIALSLAMAYVPGLNEWYNGLDKPGKARTMAILLIAAGVVIFGAGCFNLIAIVVACNSTGALDLIKILVAALVANQGTFKLLVQPYEKQETLLN